jgi:hypothetical protein
MSFTAPHPHHAVAQNTTANPAHIRHHDVQWNRPVFRAPSLPSASQIWSEVPFTAHFPGKSFQAKAK